ncbi:hypothetical protein, partial [Actinotignum timonense]|uniref:hypothetical protein n=1 Tax=Actinotignum timonense TaxID=1870995 RepID=UPI002A83C948
MSKEHGQLEKDSEQKVAAAEKLKAPMDNAEKALDEAKNKEAAKRQDIKQVELALTTAPPQAKKTLQDRLAEHRA